MVPGVYRGGISALEHLTQSMARRFGDLIGYQCIKASLYHMKLPYHTIYTCFSVTPTQTVQNE